MDYPDTTLETLRQAVSVARTELATSEFCFPVATKDLRHVLTIFAESFDSLDGWLSKGGFLPESWSQAHN